MLDFDGDPVEVYKEAGDHDQAGIDFIEDWWNSQRTKQARPDWDWYIWLLLAGRGFGKTRTLASDAIEYAFCNREHRIACIGPTHADVRKTIFEGESGIISKCPGELIASYNKSLLQITFVNGSIIEGHSAETPDRLRGPQYHRAYCDELASWTALDDTWSNLMFGLRLGDKPQIIITTTPRPLPFLRDLIAREGKDVAISRGSMFENAANLSARAVQAMRDQYEGTRLGKQELYGEILMDVPGALWTWDTIQRVGEVEDLDQVVVAIDPSGSPTGDEVGIIACGRRGKEYFVLADASLNGSPSQWARAGIRLYDADDILADRLVAEKNFGGDMVRHTIKTEAESMFRRGQRDTPELRYRDVTASRGKVLRAEPISGLYEQGRVFHVGEFKKLEDEMTRFTAEWNRAKDGSPNRVDALVFALTELQRGASRDGSLVGGWA